MRRHPALPRSRWRLAPPPSRREHPVIGRLANVPRDLGPPPPLVVPAAQYIRMSTEHQQYSTLNQRAAIERYAAQHGFCVVKDYCDEARSGLSIKGRPSLAALVEDVAGRRAQYRAVLVYDVSRWGRFQDCDESAYYEFLCRKMGIQVHYCMEPFPNDGSTVSTVIKALKRIMAAEYSRELSVKVADAKLRMVQRGLRPGGRAGYGLRRLLLDPSGTPRGILEAGQYKYVREDRIVIVPGPPEELRTVRWVFRQVAEHGLRPTAIAEELNRRGVRSGARPWTEGKVQSLLDNEEYIGNLVYNRTSMRLKAPSRPNPPEQWVRHNGAFAPVIPPELFYRAQAAMARWPTRISNEEALAALRRLLKRHGRLTGNLVNASPSTPPKEFYRSRFGGLSRAYELVGYRPRRDCRFLATHGARKAQAAALRQEVLRGLQERGVTAELATKVVVRIGGRLRIFVALGYCRTRAGRRFCHIQVHFRPPPDGILVARLDPENRMVQDYWLVRGGSNLLLGVKVYKDRGRREASSLAPLLDELVRWSNRPEPGPASQRGRSSGGGSGHG